MVWRYLLGRLWQVEGAASGALSVQILKEFAFRGDARPRAGCVASWLLRASLPEEASQEVMSARGVAATARWIFKGIRFDEVPPSEIDARHWSTQAPSGARSSARAGFKAKCLPSSKPCWINIASSRKPVAASARQLRTRIPSGDCLGDQLITSF